jgi:dTDP-4-dehydrorhamnose 3,5-epimerase
MIEGVKVKQLKMIPDERGFVMEMLRSDDEIFQKFGQVYLSVAYPGVVKGWHYHKLQTDYFTIMKGMMKVVLYDQRKDSQTYGQINEFFMGEQRPILLVIPTYVVHGMKAVGTEPGYLINCPTLPYDQKSPDEYRIDPHSGEIPYNWERKDG